MSHKSLGIGPPGKYANQRPEFLFVQQKPPYVASPKPPAASRSPNFGKDFFEEALTPLTPQAGISAGLNDANRETDHLGSEAIRSDRYEGRRKLWIQESQEKKEWDVKMREDQKKKREKKEK